MADDPEEMKTKMDELQKQFEEMKQTNERLRIEKDAAENLLRGIDRGQSQTQQNYLGPDRSVDAGKLVREQAGVNIPPAQQDFDKNLEAQLQDYLKKFTAEQLQDPESLRGILYEFGKNVGGFAYQNATRTALDIFQKSVAIKNNIDAIIADWRKRNPELANKEDEDMVEYILMNRIANDPVHRGKHLSTLLDLATEQMLQMRGEKGNKKRTEPTTTPLTVRPSKIAAAASPKEEEEEEPQNDVDKFFNMRRNMNQKRQWTGRPSS
jgi:hypothetical protein